MASEIRCWYREQRRRTVKIHNLLVSAKRVGRNALVLSIVGMINVVDSQTPNRQRHKKQS